MKRMIENNDMEKTILMILSGVLLGILFTFFKGTAIMLVVIVIITIALWNFLPKPDRGILMTLFISGISARIIIFTIVYIISVLNGGTGDLVPDSRLYAYRALYNIRVLTDQTRYVNQIEGMVGENGYLYILSFFYFILGVDKLPIYDPILFSEKLINCLIGTLSGVVIFYIAKEIFNRKVAKIASMLVVFFPSLFFWSMTNVRDPINILLVALIILSIIKIQKSAKAKYFVLLFSSLALLFTIRQYVFFPMLITVSFSLLALVFQKCKKKILFVILLVVFLATFFKFVDYGKNFNFDANIKKLYSLNSGILSQRGNYYKIYDDDFLISGRPNRLKFIKAFFKGSFYFMFSPLPWTISSIKQIITYPQMLIWYLIFPFSLIGIFFAFRYRLKISLSLLCYTLLLTALFALVEGNIGSTVRHRDLLTPFYFIFGVAGIVNVFGGLGQFEK